MGGLSNIIDGLYSDGNDTAEDEATQPQNSDEMSPDNRSSDDLRIPAEASDDRVEPWIPSDGTKSSLQELADQMSAGGTSDPESEDADDVFSTPARDESDFEKLAPAPEPPSDVETSQFSAMVASAAGDSGEDFSIASPPPGLTEQDSEAMTDDTISGSLSERLKASTTPDDSDIYDVGIDSGTSSTVTVQNDQDEDEVDLLELEGSHPFIWTRASDDIVPSKRRR